jgi:hypothetical protein
MQKCAVYTKMPLDYVELHAHGNAPQIGHIAYSATVSKSERLKVALNSCARYIYGISWFEHFTQYANRILKISLEQFYSFRMCCTMNNIIKTACPRYLFSEIQFGQSSCMFNIIIPFHRLNRMSTSFFILWNGVAPHDVMKREGSIEKFREKCLSHLG